MGVSHSPELVPAAFDDPILVSCAGLAPVLTLAHRCGLAELVAGTLTLPGEGRCERAREGRCADRRDGRWCGLNR